tara:strand:- start:206008 stop:206394 length:387 start_codon:yes stop_codon:yes gene_type:complete
MSGISLERLCELSLTFREALDKQLDASSENKNNALNSLTTRELAQIQDKEMRYAAETFNTVATGTTDEFFKLELEVCDLTVLFAQRVLDIGTLSVSVPDELLTPHAINALKEHGAHNLAAICEHKLSL